MLITSTLPFEYRNYHRRSAGSAAPTLSGVVLRHLPNALTASRGLAGFLVAGLLLTDHRLLAFWAYIAAISTDLFDGWLARRLNAQSTTGEWLDPVSDKVLAGLCWIALLAVGWAPLWLGGALLLRDVIIVCFALIGRRQGRVFEPNLAGRLMVSFEGVTLPFLLLHAHWAGTCWMSAGVALGTLTLGLAVVSAVQYARVWTQAV
jgi:cardiolipin synthase (CMP-forming)